MNPGSAAARESALDFTKGVLVLVMVLYHVMNILSTAGSSEFAYIRFVSGSFIFVSGYIIARFYADKFRSDWHATVKRLLLRGLKLLILFSVLNLSVNLLGIGNPSKAQGGVAQFFGNLYSVYVLGDVRYTSFQILLPISYLLIFSPLILSLRLPWAAVVLASLTAALLYSYSGTDVANLEFLIVGASGLGAGLLANAYPGRFRMRNKTVLLACFGGSILLMPYCSQNLVAYVLAVAVIIKVLCDFGSVIDAQSRPARALGLLGQYSLACYIGQIGIIHGLSRALSHGKWELGVEILLFFVGTSMLLLGVCISLKRMRDRSTFIDKSYRYVFS